ncbi:hypothetical protein F7725_012186, partial [Dissostichus mawsoni]
MDLDPVFDGHVSELLQLSQDVSAHLGLTAALILGCFHPWISNSPSFFPVPPPSSPAPVQSRQSSNARKTAALLILKYRCSDREVRHVSLCSRLYIHVKQVSRGHLKGRAWLFVAHCWLAVNQSDGRVERILGKCTRGIGFFK